MPARSRQRLTMHPRGWEAITIIIPLQRLCSRLQPSRIHHGHPHGVKLVVGQRHGCFVLLVVAEELQFELALTRELLPRHLQAVMQAVRLLIAAVTSGIHMLVMCARTCCAACDMIM
jgi:hypothetical protein